VTRHRPPTRSTWLAALFTCPLVHDLAADIDDPAALHRQHPLALHLAWAAMARLWGSSNRLDAELGDRFAWAEVVDRYNAGAHEHPLGHPVPRNAAPLTSDAYRHVRTHLSRPDVLDAVLEAFTLHNVKLARSIGLLNPEGPGSRTRPHPTRTIYGDGTILRPLYRPTNAVRRDPDAAEHVRHDGAVWGNNLVTVAVRGPAVHQRVLLALGRVDQPGREAATAVTLIQRVHAHAGEGVQAVVYDGAFRGVHHDQLMRSCGVVVINNVHPAAKRANDSRTYRVVPLGRWLHHPQDRDCAHTLVAHGGAVHDATMDDGGQLVLSDPLARHQVRRYATARSGGWRFSLGVKVPCPRDPFVAWISPHPQAGDTTNRRPDQLRLLPKHDPLFPTLYGLRNDSEAINSAYKRTLIADRAAALGWRRQLLDLHAWALLNNTLAWYHHAPRPAGAHRE
jgi:hypothetical protein